MKHLINLTLLVSILSFGCQRQDGKYIVYSTNGNVNDQLYVAGFGSFSTNDTINKYLCNKLNGNIFDVHFNKEYATMQSVGSDDLLVLHREVANGVTYYTLNKATNQKVWAFRLYVPNDGPLIFQVILGFNYNDRLVLPVQLGGNNPHPEIAIKRGIAICYLSKTD